MINRFIRLFFYAVIVRFVMGVILGLNVRNKDRLPLKGPAIIVSNHNSHLDTMALMTLMTKRCVPVAKPVAAADYFLRNGMMKWFALSIVGILPINRTGKDKDPLQPVRKALRNHEVLIFFPEGSRGAPEMMSELKGGIAKLSEQFPDVPVIPVFMYGLGKALPKGEALLVPFFCDVFVGEALYWKGDRELFLRKLKRVFSDLSRQVDSKTWES